MGVHRLETAEEGRDLGALVNHWITIRLQCDAAVKEANAKSCFHYSIRTCWNLYVLPCYTPSWYLGSKKHQVLWFECVLVIQIKLVPLLLPLVWWCVVDTHCGITLAIFPFALTKRLSIDLPSPSFLEQIYIPSKAVLPHFFHLFFLEKLYLSMSIF